MTRLEKEKKEKSKQRAGRLTIIHLQDKLNMVLEKGATPGSGKWNNTDLKVMPQWFKREVDKAMPKNKEGLLLRYHETCARVVEPVTYYEQDEEDAARVATAAVGIGVPTVGVASSAVGSRAVRACVASGAVGSRAGIASALVDSRAARAAVGSPAVGSPAVSSPAVSSRTDHAAVGSHIAHAAGSIPTAHAAGGTPTNVLWSLGTAAGKPTFAAEAAGIPDAAHASTITQYQLTISNIVAAIGATYLHQSSV
jgi:hypothetical protein